MTILYRVVCDECGHPSADSDSFSSLVMTLNREGWGYIPEPDPAVRKRDRCPACAKDTAIIVRVGGLADASLRMLDGDAWVSGDSPPRPGRRQR